MHLHERHGITLQMGGSDQWGNITAGSDFIRKRWRAMNPDAPDDAGPQVYAVTAPLLTKSDGTKFGKSESGAVWLTADRTSPYALYQYLLNSADADVPRLLRTLTDLPEAEIQAALDVHEKEPGQREAHRVLAFAVTSMLHGITEADLAVKASKALFSGEIAELSAAMIDEVFSAVPTSSHDKAILEAGISIIDMLVLTKLADSKGQAKEFLGQGAVSINGRKVGATDLLRTADLLHGHVIALRRGKKNWHVTRWN
jgi:tyrosyl-tRNA synthetase